MTTDRIITIKNGADKLKLTDLPYTVHDTEGFDSIKINHETSVAYGIDGATILGSRVNTRSLKIRGEIKADTPKEMQALRDALIAIFRPKTDIEITQSYGGEERSITARATNTPKIKLTDMLAIQTYEVELTAMQPYWEAGAQTTTIAETVGSFHFPVRHPSKFGLIQEELIAKVTNDSPDEVGAVIKFIAHGVVKNPSIINIYTRECMKLECEMSGGEIITITTGGKKTVVRTRDNAETNYIGKVDLAGGNYDFITIKPGDNYFRTMADEGESLLETKIIVKELYAGV